MFKKFKLTFNFAIKMLGLFSRRSLLFFSPPHPTPTPLLTVPRKVMTVTVDNPGADSHLFPPFYENRSDFS